MTLLSGCAIGPLVSHETARTVGKSKHEFIGGSGNSGFVFKWNYGLADNLDIGLHMENLSTGVRAKYSFLNNKSGWSFATAFGIGSSIGGDHYYGDIIGSYMKGSWEPYGTLRIVHVNTDSVDVMNEDTGNFVFSVPRSEYTYSQYILGTRYWFNPRWLFSLEASSLVSFDSGVHFSDNALVGAALGYRF